MAFSSSRLSIARRRRGLTKQALAAQAGVAYRSIVAYERSETEPTEEATAKLARATTFPTAFFLRQELDSLPIDGVSFRSLARMTAAQRDRALAGGELALELVDWIDERFAFDEPDVPDLRAYGTPEAAARALRVRWGLGDKPIPNMLWLLEAKGVRVFSLAEENVEVDAYSFWRGRQPLVFLNTMKSAEHSRFDAGHELGHLVLHQHGAAVGREAETQANAFASAFLMPESSITAHAPSPPLLSALIEAKHYWKVSVAALAYRMHVVKMLSTWNYHSLCVEIQTRNYRTNEPEPEPREVSQVWPKVFAALREEGTTHRDVARQLDWPLEELQALVFQLVVTKGGATRSTKARTQLKKLHLTT